MARVTTPSVVLAGKVQPQRIHRWLSPPTTVQEFAVSQHRPSGHPHRDGAYEYEAVDASSVNENEGFLSILTPKSSKKAKATTLKQIADHFGLDSAWLLPRISRLSAAEQHAAKGSISTRTAESGDDLRGWDVRFKNKSFSLDEGGTARISRLTAAGQRAAKGCSHTHGRERQ